MKKYICSICGYVYNEAVGDTAKGIPPGTKWEDVPDSWNCPLCGAMKMDFAEEKTNEKSDARELSNFENKNEHEHEHDQESMRELSFGEVSSLCSNLSKGCAKQYRLEEAELFDQLAEFYKSKGNIESEGQLKDISKLMDEDLNSAYVQSNLIAADASDRGALRALVWGEKTTRILNSILGRYEKQQDSLLKNTHVYLCEICGFVYIGDELPDICPVCKVPNIKIIEVKRG